MLYGNKDIENILNRMRYIHKIPKSFLLGNKDRIPSSIYKLVCSVEDKEYLFSFTRYLKIIESLPEDLFDNITVSSLLSEIDYSVCKSEYDLVELFYNIFIKIEDMSTKRDSYIFFKYIIHNKQIMNHKEIYDLLCIMDKDFKLLTEPQIDLCFCIKDNYNLLISNNRLLSLLNLIILSTPITEELVKSIKIILR